MGEGEGEGEKEWGAERPHPSSTQGAPAGLPAASRGRCALAAPNPHTEGLASGHRWGQQRLIAAFKPRWCRGYNLPEPWFSHLYNGPVSLQGHSEKETR